nr:hypothetical protein [uncultured Kingella sp.]
MCVVVDMGNAFQAALGRRGCGLGKQWGLKFVNLLSGCLVWMGSLKT